METSVLVVALIVLSIVLFETRSQPARIDTYSSYDFATGGYRGFYELLEREGVRVERFQQHALELDRSVDTLVYSEPLPFDPDQAPPTPGDDRALEAWVRGGGNLVYFGYDQGAAEKGFLNLPHAIDPAKHAHAAVIAAALATVGVRSIGTIAAQRRLEVRKRGARVLTLVDDGRGAVAVSYRFGKGSVTQVIDETLFDNAGLARADRARMAVALVAPRRPGGIVSFDETVHGHVIPVHWWSIVPVPFLWAVGIAVLVLLIAMIGAAIRFGPPLVPEKPDDRTSADFIDALSTLLERGGASAKAYADAVHSTSRSLALQSGIAQDAAPESIAARIPDQERRSAFETMLTLGGSSKITSASFVRGIALAARLRKDPASHGR